MEGSLAPKSRWHRSSSTAGASSPPRFGTSANASAPRPSFEAFSRLLRELCRSDVGVHTRQVASVSRVTTLLPNVTQQVGTGSASTVAC